MELLDPLDAVFLALESREHPMHVGGLYLFETPGDTDEFVQDLYTGYLAATDVRSRFRRRLHREWGGFSLRAWSHADEVDLGYHVRRSGLPTPGGTAELLDLVARLHGQLLDRHRPLWETRLIEGLGGRRFAMYSKIHHALFDGVTGQQLATRSFTTDPLDPGLYPAWTLGAPEHSDDTPHRAPRGGLRGLPRLAANVPSELNKGLTVLRAVTDGRLTLPMAAPRTVFNVPIGGAREIAIGSLSLDRIDAVRRATGTTVNDIVLAISAGALRTYLLERQALPDRPLVAMVPMNMRTPAEAEIEGNLVAALLANLATDVADPVQRLTAISTSMQSGKQVFSGLSRRQAQALSLLLLAPAGLDLVPGLPHGPRVPFNVTISNVPGHRKARYLQGARLEHWYPLSIPFDGQGVNITVAGNGDSIDIGVVGCRRAAPNLARLVTAMDDSLADLEFATR
jgi:WS/DGAT/MGAT family acyltransferase